MRRTGNLALVGRKCVLCLLPFLVIFFFSCATFRTSDAVDEVVRLREKCEEMQQAIEKGYFDTCAKGKVSRQARIHKDFDYLLTPTKLEILDRRFASTKDPEEKEAVSRLKRFLISKNIGDRQSGVIDDIFNFAAETVITVDGHSVLYRHLPWYLANEKDRDVRRKLYLASSRAFEADNVFLGQLLTIQSQGITSFGYSSYLDFFAEDRFFEPEKMKQSATDFLAATDSVYASILEEISQEQFQITPADLRSYDLPRIFRMEEFDSHFPAKRALDIVDKTLEAMGLALKKQSGLRLDVGQGQEMVTGSRVLPVFVPLDVRLVQKNVGGAPDYAALLHSAALALHYCNTTESLFEYRTLGTHSLREGYGFLFEFLLDDPAWLDQFVKIPPEKQAAYTKLRAFARLYEARQMCGAFLFQLTLLEGRERVHDNFYEIMAPVLMFGVTDRDAERALRLNDFFYVTDRIRGLFLEPYIREAMKSQFGKEWFRDPDAGRYLLGQWSGGQKTALSSVEKQLEADSHNWKRAAADIMEMLGHTD
ncbi:MAG: hypothetical protein AMJ46_10455 [Latescibacteria bacterium DG_63]|nr:MAG: hypothetical protein AMJ46_10455 [Latescibacteria bacterium DG_63]